MGYRGYGLPISEVIAEGNVGLMQAVKRFEPERGFRLATYAMWWIRASIQEYILRSWSLVKMGTTAAQKKLFFNLRKREGPDRGARGRRSQARPGQDDRDPPGRARGRGHLDEPPPLRADSSLNAPLRAANRESRVAGLAGRRHARPGNAARRVRGARRAPHAASTALDELTPRERDILEARRLRDDPVTLEDLSVKYGISRERVRQIEVRAFEKLQEKMKAALRSKRAETLDAR